MTRFVTTLKSFFLPVCFFLSLLPLVTSAQDTPQPEKEEVDSIYSEGYSLIFVNKAPAFDATVKQRMTNAFFKVYPQEAKRFNPNTAKKVVFVIDPAYDGVAATSNDVVVYNPEWFRKHPGDIDVVTHEVMHIVQAYPNGSGPGWLTEGIADYVRHTMGVDNKGAGWELPAFSEKQHYRQSYRVMARFLVWLENNERKDIVDLLDKSMRTKKYTPGIWKQLTGKTLDELWAAYAQKPGIEKVVKL